MSTTIACIAEPWAGGLGRHFGELLESLSGENELAAYYSCGLDPRLEGGERVPWRTAELLYRLTPLRFSPGWTAYADAVLFDLSVARRLRPADVHIGFAGQSLRTFLRARRLGFRRLELVAATSHVNNVARRLHDASRAHPFERPWLNDAQRRRTLREYDLADGIHVSTEYARATFLAEGVPPEKLLPWSPRPSARFARAPERTNDRIFRVVYIGALSVAKGVPVLIEAFSRLSDHQAELTLVGAAGSRGMRRYLELSCRRDSRVKVAPGDPLVHLRRAAVLVHPSYQDGFGYGPMEALAGGVPVIVTEDTGMKEHVREGENGFVVPTGSPEAILERLRWYRDAWSAEDEVEVAARRSS